MKTFQLGSGLFLFLHFPLRFTYNILLMENPTATPPPETSPSSRGPYYVILTLVSLFLLLPLGLAYSDYHHADKLQATASYFSDQWIMHFFIVCAFAYFFYVGATLGSFLNVVSYRLPRRQTLCGSSSCPGCKTRIKMYHNQPIFGWIWLGGRCPTCRMKISIRYLVVELLAALSIGSIAIFELLCAGINLIDQPRTQTFYFEQMMVDPPWNLIGYFLIHSFLLTVLLTIAVIRFQNDIIPRRLYGFSFGVAIVLLALWPLAIPFDQYGVAASVDSTPFTSLTSGLIGTLTGAVAGLMFVPAMVTNQIPDRWSVCLSLGLVGALLGWQCVLLATLICCFLHMNIRIMKRRMTPDHVLWLATTIAIIGMLWWVRIITA